MKAFRILLALAIAGATFYSLNAFAVKNGFQDRLVLKTGIIMSPIAIGNTTETTVSVTTTEKLLILR